MGYIYKHTSPSGKAYIGQSMQAFGLRWKDHVSNAKRHLDCCPGIGRAIRKYGPDAFTHEILHDGIDDLEELNRLEQREIAAHGTLAPRGYNLTDGGEGGQMAPLCRARHSTVMRGIWADEERRARHSDILKRAAATPEVRASLRTRWTDDLHDNRRRQCRLI